MVEYFQEITADANVPGGTRDITAHKKVTIYENFKIRDLDVDLFLGSLLMKMLKLSCTRIALKEGLKSVLWIGSAHNNESAT